MENVRYADALKKVNGRLKFGMKPGLRRIEMLLERLDNPQDKLRFVHVGGTNGKGSACALLSSVLTESGYKTGLFTSPYVIEFRERFQIDREMISEENLIKEIEIIAKIADEMQMQGEEITEFEFITALAINWFYKSGCDIVVLEVGLGGKLDSTNVISTPEVAAIMSVSLDHTNILGSTVREIARDKSGIIKENGSVVLYPNQEQETFEEIEKACKKSNAKLRMPDISKLEIISEEIDGTGFRQNGREPKTPFLGKHQIYNAVTVLEVIDTLIDKGYKITDSAVKNGFEKATMPARMEVLSKEPLIIMDGGHNIGCALALKSALKEFAKNKRIVALMGMAEDKDSDSVAKILVPMFSEVVVTKSLQPRSMPAEKLAEFVGHYTENLVIADKPVDAVDIAFEKLANSDKETALIVCGSFYLASDIRENIIERIKKM